LYSQSQIALQLVKYCRVSYNILYS